MIVVVERSIILFTCCPSTEPPIREYKVKWDIEHNACQPGKPEPEIFSSQLRSKMLMTYPTPIWIRFVPVPLVTCNDYGENDHIRP